MSEPSRPSITPGVAHRRMRRYLINPQFQLKYTAYLVVVVLAVMVAFGFVIFRIASSSAEHAAYAAEQAEKALKESQTSGHVLQMQTISSAGEDAGLAKMLEEELAKKDKEYEQNLLEVRHRKGEIEAARERLFYFLLGSGAFILLLLVGMGIFITHRIVGPVFKLKRLLRQVATGKLVIKERLRKGDELNDLFETFLQMTLSLKVLSLDRIATLDDAIDAAEKGQVSPAVLEKLQAVRGQMRLW